MKLRLALLIGMNFSLLSAGAAELPRISEEQTLACQRYGSDGSKKMTVQINPDAGKMTVTDSRGRMISGHYIEVTDHATRSYALPKVQLTSANLALWSSGKVSLNAFGTTGQECETIQTLLECKATLLNGTKPFASINVKKHVKSDTILANLVTDSGKSYKGEVDEVDFQVGLKKANSTAYASYIQVFARKYPQEYKEVQSIDFFNVYFTVNGQEVNYDLMKFNGKSFRKYPAVGVVDFDEEGVFTCE